MMVRDRIAKQTVPVTFRVPVAIQRHVIRSLGFSEAEYLEALPCPSRALV
jgi:hypothetical protein